jgi:hypothetical protein
VLQVVERDVGGHREQQRAFERWVVEQAVAELPPPFLELDLGRDLVEHLDVGRQPRLDRMLGQDPLGERVQRGDRGGIHLLERGTERPSGVCRHLVLERMADAVTQFGGGLLGERDRRDLAHGDARAHQRDDAVDQ